MIGDLDVGDVLTCGDLDCVDVEVGVIHHPLCGRPWDPEEYDPPLSPEDEETLPPDPHNPA